MDRGRILVLYGTSYGQTRRIANHLGRLLQWAGHDVTVVDAATGELREPLTSFDVVLIGSSIIARGHQKPVERFIRANVATLNAMPSAFFSVSASAGSRDPAGRAAAERVRDAFLAGVGWRPQVRESVAGAVNYTKYNPLLRWYMKRASQKGGGSTDTSRDHEYTDWSQVERLARSVGALVPGSTAPLVRAEASV